MTGGRLRFGLTSRLQAVALLALSPLLLLVTWWTWQDFREAEANARLTAQRSVGNVARGLEEHLLGVRRALVALAQASELRDHAPAACNALVTRARAALPLFLVLAVTGPDGTVRCSSLAQGKPVTARGRPYFERALQLGDIALGEYQIGRATGLPSINLAYPFAGRDEAPAGALIAAIGTDVFANFIANARLPPATRLTLIDRGGTVIARSGDGVERWVGRRAADLPLIREVLARGEGQLDAAGLDGEPRMHAFAPVLFGGEPALYAIVGIARDDLVVSAWENLFARLAFLALVVAVALLAAALASRRLVVAPLQKLTASAERWQAGDLTARSGLPHTGDEIGKLCRSFDESALALQTSQEAIRRSQADLAVLNRDLERRVAERTSALEQANRELVLAANYDVGHGDALRLMNSIQLRRDLLAAILALLAERFPFPAGAVFGYDEWTGCYDFEVGHGVSTAFARRFRAGEGLLGEAARQGRLAVIGTDAASAGFALETGVADLRPAAVLLAPILFQERRLGVLVLLAAQPIGERERSFVERLCGHLAVALHNQRQHDDVRLLADQLRLRGEEVSAKNAQLEEANRLKSEFLATMSHELRTPLNAIIGFSEVLKDGLAGPLADRQLEFCEEIFASGRHLLALINDVLDLSKIEAGRMALELEPVDLRELAQNSLSVVREQANARHLTLEAQLDRCPAQLMADPRKLKQILYNLLSNAVKFTPDDGHVSLQVRGCGKAEVLQALASRAGRTRGMVEGAFADFVEIVVRDSGIGIAAEDQGRLFQPFTQLDSDLSRRYAGTGLGLAMVHRLVDLHGGAVAVDSVPGGGSAFYVWLPQRELAMSAEQAPVAPVIRAPAAGSRVLVVEDDPAAWALIASQLADEGLEAVQAPTAEMAEKLLAQEPVDLIILDILLPGIDGWELLARLKASPAVAAVPVVIVSIVADTRRGLSLGAAEVLQKPVGRDELLGALARLGFVEASTNRRRVLVVDDDPHAVEIVASHLEHARFAVVRAYGGAEAVESARRERPALIILDLLMPDMSGFEVVESLKGCPETAGIPILVLTAKDLTAADRDALYGHVQRIMHKADFNHGRFVGEVRRALRRSAEVV